ncbi:hypothetical protein K431DRAFT_338178 [Polychaeton citri CBS 116435]|uniref:Uncharacterized protein n=1 Tax=Polychaeton citri CBS 116435 TaxID=1314669 RepID=A0A9P4Q851_9PEZI|nr:hypothetical protein K431DRAFT_338178 [Polychaeton citri CBS 116435]
MRPLRAARPRARTGHQKSHVLDLSDYGMSGWQYARRPTTRMCRCFAQAKVAMTSGRMTDQAVEYWYVGLVIVPYLGCLVTAAFFLYCPAASPLSTLLFLLHLFLCVQLLPE